MPQYVHTINGQRHVFEGSDPQTTARFAQQWANQNAARTPVTVADIQRWLGPPRSQFATDIGARVNKDVTDLTRSIDEVRAHPTSLLNAPKILGAVARYGSNAFGLLPAATVDQATGPVVRGINARFGSHFDHRYATDQILNAAGVLLGAGELDPELALGGAGETPVERDLLSGPGEAASPRLLTPPDAVSMRRLTTHIGNQPLLSAPRPKPTLAYEAPELGDHVLGQNSQGENVVPLSDSFLESHKIRKASLSDLPEDLQSQYSDPIAELIFDPVLDDPDYAGHNTATIKDIESRLNDLASAHRSQGGDNVRIGDALADAGESLRTMVAEQQPEMAKELGYLPAGDPGPKWGARPRPIPAAAGSKPADVMRFESYVKPQGSQMPAWMQDRIRELSPDERERLAQQWTAMRDAGAKQPEPSLPDGVVAFTGKFRPPPSPAANDNAERDSEEYLKRYLPAPWSPPGVPAVWNPPRAQLPVVWKPPGTQLPAANAFSAPPGLQWTIVPRAPRPASGINLNFNALRPPQWGPLGMVAAANLPQDPQQSQN